MMYQLFVKLRNGKRVNLGIFRTEDEVKRAKDDLFLSGETVDYEPVTIVPQRTYLYRKGNLKLRLTLGYDPTDAKLPYRWKIHCAESPFPVHCGSWFIGLPWEKMHEHIKREGFELSYMVKNDKAYRLASKLVLRAQVVTTFDTPYDTLKCKLFKVEAETAKPIAFNTETEHWFGPDAGFRISYCANDRDVLYNLYREEKVWEEV